jgi:hypothetical protein
MPLFKNLNSLKVIDYIICLIPLGSEPYRFGPKVPFGKPSMINKTIKTNPPKYGSFIKMATKIQKKI